MLGRGWEALEGQPWPTAGHSSEQQLGALRFRSWSARGSFLWIPDFHDAVTETTRAD